MADELCCRLLGDTHASERVLTVTVGQTPASRRRQWEAHLAAEGFAAEFIDIAAQTRSTAATPADPSTSVRTLSDPTDLATLGRTIGERVDAADGDLTLCLHSLSDLLQYVEQEAALQFCHTLSARVTDAGATAHYHLDSTLVDEETVALFSTVTDRVLTSEGLAD